MDNDKTHANKRLVAGILIALGVFSAAPIMAQESDQSGDQDSADQQADSGQQFSDQQIKQFVAAQNNVQQAQGEWRDKIQNAKDKDAAKQNANKAMVEAVTNSGLSVETYNKMARTAQTSPKLTKRIQAQMVPQ